MRYQIEHIGDLIPEMEELVKIHYETVSTHKHLKRLDPDWDRFIQLTDDEVCRTMTARTGDGELVGYFITFIVPHIHFRPTIMAHNDAVFLHPDHRGRASFGLFNAAIEDLRNNTEADILACHMKIHLPFRKLLNSLGFNQTEENWELEL